MPDNAPKPKNSRIPYDSLTLRAVVAELRPLIVGGQIQEVRQPAPTELLLGIRSRGQNLLLALSNDAQFARVHLTQTKSPNAPTPPSFCMALRKYAEGASVLDVRQRGFDRIFEMEIGTRSEGEVRPVCTLIAELMGKHSNLILVHADGTILDAAKRVSHRINRVRETLPGLPYQPPPDQSEKHSPFAPDALALLLTPDFADAAADSLSERLLTLYAGMSPFLAQELAARALQNGNDVEAGIRQAWEEVFGAAARGQFQPVLARDQNGRVVGAYPFPLVTRPQATQEAVQNFNFALDTAFTELRERAEREAIAGELRGKIGQEIKRLERQKQDLERALAESDRAEQYKQAGELLLANLYRLESGAEFATVQDYYTPDQSERTIVLDPKLSPQENAENYFRRYRKSRDGQETALERGVTVETNLETLHAAQTQLEMLTDTDAIRALRSELTTNGLLREQQAAEESGERAKPDFEGHKIRRITTPEGYEIYIGESATANDFLTTRLASSNDIWLHVRAATGSHVVIRTHGKPEAVPRSVLEQAALLAARQSAQKHSSLVAVDYTLKKYVRKPRGAAPGSVLIQQEKTLHVTPSQREAISKRDSFQT